MNNDIAAKAPSIAARMLCSQSSLLKLLFLLFSKITRYGMLVFVILVFTRRLGVLPVLTMIFLLCPLTGIVIFNCVRGVLVRTL